MNIRLLPLLSLFCLLPLVACGHKGSLKTPSQIEKMEAKRAAKAAKEEAKVAKENQAIENAETPEPE